MNQLRPVIVHITASPCFGGPERQMIELGYELSASYRSVYATFAEEGRCKGFVDHCQAVGIEVHELKRDTPRLVAAYAEVRKLLRTLNAQVVIAHGYKANILGQIAARSLQIPVVSVSRGWTAESWKVRIFERLDRLALRSMNRVICVSKGQATKVCNAGVSKEKIVVIHNAIRPSRFQQAPDPQFREQLLQLFGEVRPRAIIGAAGRLSPEKGFDVLIDAAAMLNQKGDVDFGIVLFGDGVLREELQRRIDLSGVGSRFILAGFTAELDSYMPHFDVFVQSSHTEGLPNVLLEAAAAGVPVVATNVGGTAEVVVDAETGMLVPSGDAVALADSLRCQVLDSKLRVSLQLAARQHVFEKFTFAAQADLYKQLLRSILS